MQGGILVSFTQSPLQFSSLISFIQEQSAKTTKTWQTPEFDLGTNSTNRFKDPPKGSCSIHKISDLAKFSIIPRSPPYLQNSTSTIRSSNCQLKQKPGPCSKTKAFS
eukprot:c55093_g1_i1 orf=3-320(-)